MVFSSKLASGGLSGRGTSALFPKEQDLCKVLPLNLRCIGGGFPIPSPFEARVPAKIFPVASQLLRLLVM